MKKNEKINENKKSIGRKDIFNKKNIDFEWNVINHNKILEKRTFFLLWMVTISMSTQISEYLMFFH